MNWIDISQNNKYKWTINTWKKISTSLAVKGTQIKTTLRFNLILVRMVVIKKTNKCLWGCERKEPLYTVGGNVNQWSHYESNMDVPQQTKNRATKWSYYTTLRQLSEGYIKSAYNRDICIPI
jgi:hypothetical protein